MPRRKPGTLLPLENEILLMALRLSVAGEPSFYGFGIAQALGQDSGSRSLVAHGTLYKALGRLEDFGLLTSRWEDVADGRRPRRRLYELTAAGRAAAQTARTPVVPPARVSPRPA